MFLHVLSEQSPASAPTIKRARRRLYRPMSPSCRWRINWGPGMRMCRQPMGRNRCRSCGPCS